MGAAVATFAGILVQNIGHLTCLRFSTNVGTMHRRLAQAWLSFIFVAGLLVAVQWAIAPPLFVALALVTAGGTFVLFLNRNALAADAMFPELARLPIVGRLVAARANAAE